MPLFMPDIYLKKITDLTPQMLKDRGIKGMLIDVDNTVALRKKQEPLEGLIEWLDLMKLNGIELMILSNANPKRVRPFAQKLGLPFYYFTCKPFPLRIWMAINKLSVDRKSIAVVGDQIFTDIIGGRFCGITTILVEPIELENGINYKIKRKLERIIMRRFKS